jgi:hypothetical protein
MAGVPAPRRAAIPPPVWLVIWLAMASEWLRGYMGGLFYDARVILTPYGRAASPWARGHASPSPSPDLMDPDADPLAPGRVPDLSNFSRDGPIDWRRSWDEALLGCGRGGRRPAAETQEALAAASEMASPVLGAILAGWLTMRAGRRAACFVGVALMAAGQLVGGVTADYAVYFAGYGLHSAGGVISLQVCGGWRLGAVWLDAV